MNATRLSIAAQLESVRIPRWRMPPLGWRMGQHSEWQPPTIYGCSFVRELYVVGNLSFIEEECVWCEHLIVFINYIIKKVTLQAFRFSLFLLVDVLVPYHVYRRRICTISNQTHISMNMVIWWHIVIEIYERTGWVFLIINQWWTGIIHRIGRKQQDSSSKCKIHIQMNEVDGYLTCNVCLQVAWLLRYYVGGIFPTTSKPSKLFNFSQRGQTFISAGSSEFFWKVQFCYL